MAIMEPLSFLTCAVLELYMYYVRVISSGTLFVKPERFESSAPRRIMVCK
jgi:hypothetical protein